MSVPYDVKSGFVPESQGEAGIVEARCIHEDVKYMYRQSSVLQNAKDREGKTLVLMIKPDEFQTT
jgi:hypothetical protein